MRKIYPPSAKSDKANGRQQQGQAKDTWIKIWTETDMA